jgi:hypothetical protein
MKKPAIAIGNEIIPSTMKSLLWSVAQNVQDYQLLEVLPLPALQSPLATKMVHSSHQVSREHGAKGTAGMKNAGSFCKLVPPIPGTNHILHSRIESTFSQANEKTQDINLGCGIAARKAHGEYCPNDLSSDVR